MTPAARTPTPISTSANNLLGDVPLPSFILIQDDALLVDISALDSPELLRRFVDRVFATDACFEGLDYATFLKLLFEAQPHDINALLEDYDRRGTTPWLRLANNIVPFAPQRQALYRGLSLKNGRADYFFEPVSSDHEEDGRTVTTVETLCFDEFVAAMWRKGLRYGIDEALVRQKLAEAKAERLSVASPRVPTEGADASIGDTAKSMQRNDAPRLRNDGRVDLARYENRFPQINAGQRLFCKLPSIPGVPGHDIEGNELPAAPVKDFSLRDLAGPGTQIEHIEGEGDYVVALINGFLNVDATTGCVSVSEKIINKVGVNARTTGNLSLAGQEYEEHGEVQEKRNVDGHHMSFYADVFGNISSSGGRVLIKRALAGGSAKSPGGSVIVEGSASRASIDAGEVTIKSAEGCLIIADRVCIDSAVMCDIVADTVEIAHAQGCAIAARHVAIKRSEARRAESNLVCMLLPDLAAFDANHAELESALSTSVAAEAPLREQIAALTAEPDMKSYMALAPKIRAKEMVLRGEQEANWQKLVARLAPRIKDVSRLNGQLQELRKTSATLRERITDNQRLRAEALAAVDCRIDDIGSETLVRLRRVRFDDPPLARLPTKELRQRLHEAGLPAERIYFGDAGSLVWPEAADDSGDS